MEIGESGHGDLSSNACSRTRKVRGICTSGTYLSYIEFIGCIGLQSRYGKGVSRSRYHRTGTESKPGQSVFNNPVGRSCGTVGPAEVNRVSSGIQCRNEAWIGTSWRIVYCYIINSEVTATASAAACAPTQLDGSAVSRKPYGVRNKRVRFRCLYRTYQGIETNPSTTCIYFNKKRVNIYAVCVVVEYQLRCSQCGDIY